MQLVFLAFQNQTAAKGNSWVPLRPLAWTQDLVLPLPVSTFSQAGAVDVAVRALVLGQAGAGCEVDVVPLQKLLCSYQTALCFGVSKECSVQIAENRELGASMLHKTEVKTYTNVHGILPRGQYLFHSHSMILFLMSRQST